MDVALNIAILQECKTPTSHNASQGPKAREHNSKTSRKPQRLKEPYRPNEHPSSNHGRELLLARTEDGDIYQTEARAETPST
jgi:hypothetical protein